MNTFLAMIVIVIAGFVLSLIPVVPPIARPEAAIPRVATPTLPISPVDDGMGANEREQWAHDILHGVGNDAPTPATVAFIVEWTLAEDRGEGALARNNPLNTTQDGFNTTQNINEDGVKGYRTHADGLAATLQTLSYSPYSELVAALRANDPEQALAALIASPWASSHYGGGATWPHYSIGSASRN